MMRVGQSHGVSGSDFAVLGHCRVAGPLEHRGLMGVTGMLQECYRHNLPHISECCEGSNSALR